MFIFLLSFNGNSIPKMIIKLNKRKHFWTFKIKLPSKTVGGVVVGMCYDNAENFDKRIFSSFLA